MIEWSGKYLIGIERIDLEHKIFLSLIDDLYNATHKTPEKKNLEATLNEIILYAKFHFYSEENIMVRLGYPGLEAHRAIHYQLIDALNNKVQALSLGRIKPVEVLDFLLDWFVKHTTLEDIKIAVYKNSRADEYP